MLVSFYYNPKKPEQLPHNDPSFGEPSPLRQIDLRELLYNCFLIPEGREKHEAGSMFVFVADKFYKNEYIEQTGILTDGACFCDIDNLTKEQSDIIFNSFDILCEALPNLYAVWKSYSGINLHFAFYTEQLNKEQYCKQEILSLIYLSAVIYNKTGLLLSDDKEGANNIDTHNSSISQRFYLNKVGKDSLKINNNCDIANFQDFNKEQIKKLKTLFPRLINIIYGTKEIINYVNTNKSYLIDDNNVDNSFEYIGHTQRWQAYSTFQYILKDKDTTDKYWIEFAKRIKPDKHSTNFFIEEPHKNNWFNKFDAKFINLGLLQKYGYNISNIEQHNVIKRGEWITKYSEEIIEFIKNNHRCEIVAPTGVGKTSFINGIIDKDSVFVDEFSLAKTLNAVIIVPFNVTNKLYDNLIEVSSEQRNNIRDDKPIVMIWDQALLHWDAIKDRTLIIDEAHCLFLDRRYRDTAVKLMNKIKEDNCKCVLFTATPSGEAEELDCKMLQFKNERDLIDITFNKVNTVDMSEYNIIKYCLQTNAYDKIVLFDDMNARKIWEKFIVEGLYVNDIAYIRADTKNSEDFINLREKEILTKKLTICTCVAFNGLNFKNENEKVLVITSYRKGNTTAAEIIQEAGRIRKSKVGVVVYYDDKDYTSNLENNIEKANIYQNAVVELGIPDTVLSYNRRLTNIDVVEALRRIEQHIAEESIKEKIFERLNDCGYFVIRDKDNTNDESEKGNKMNLSLKTKESKEFIEDLLNDTIGEYKPDSYKDKWNKRITTLIDNDGYTGININLFKEIILKKNKKTSIETIIAQVEKIIKITLIPDTEWKKYVDNIDELKFRLSSDLDKRDLVNNYKKNIDIRNKYIDKVKVVEPDNTYDLTLVFADLFEELAAIYDNEKQSKAVNGAVGGKNSKSNKKLYDKENNITFNSATEAALYYNKRNETITRWIKSGKLIEIK